MLAPSRLRRNAFHHMPRNRTQIASISSYNGHMHMACEGQCGMAMME